MGCNNVSNVSQNWPLPSLTGRHCEIFLSIFFYEEGNTRDTLITVLPSFFSLTEGLGEI